MPTTPITDDVDEPHARDFDDVVRDPDMSRVGASPGENGQELAPAATDDATTTSPSASTRTTAAQPTATQAAQMFVFTASKAGMKDVDKDHVQKVVFEMSKDSLFFQNSIKQNEKVEARIATMRTKLQALTVPRRETLRRQIDAQVAKLETTRDLTRTKVVVDMDMFYAAVEMRDNPSLREKPLAVGGIGMLSTTNYVARRFGVRAAMPGFIGKELCPDLIIVPPNFDKYTAISAQIREIVAHYDPQFRAMSLDEVYLDITDFMESNWTRYACTGVAIPQVGRINSDASEEDDEDQSVQCDEDIGGQSAAEDLVGLSDGDVDDRREEVLFSGGCNTRSFKRKRASSVVPSGQREEIAAAIVNEIRYKIFETTQLTASAGIAANTMLAKICSDFNKPNGQYVLPFARDDVLAFVEKLPVRKIGGIGKVMEKTLNAALGITTGKDLYDRRVETFHVFSERTAQWLLRISMGLQGGSHDEERSGRKSYSRERTFSAKGIADPRTLEKICEELCERLAADMLEGGHGTKTITLKLKCVDFSVRTRAVSTSRTVRSKDEIYSHAVELLRKEMPLRLRLMGVRASALLAMDGTSDAETKFRVSKKQAMIDNFAVPGAPIDSALINPLERDVSTNEDDRGDRIENDDSGEDDVSGQTSTRRSQKRQLAIGAFAQKQEVFDSNLGKKRHQAIMNRSQPSLCQSFQSTGTVADMSTTRDFQPCPICGKMINAGNAIAINVHVEACLQKSDTSHKQSSFHRFFRP